MPKFWVNPWLQLNNLGFPSIATLWLLMTTLQGKVTPHAIAWKVISKLNWTKILVYSSALQCKKVQSSIEVSLIKKITKNWIFFFFLSKHKSTAWKRQLISTCFFLCLKVILTMEHDIKLLTIFIRKFAIFWSWQLTLWNLGQLAPASFFYLH